MPRGGGFGVAGKATRKAGSRSSGSTNNSGGPQRTSMRASRWSKALTIGKRKKKKK